MLSRHNLIYNGRRFVIINPSGPFSPNHSMVSFSDLTTSFCISDNQSCISYIPCDHSQFCIRGFNAGCVPLRCTVQVLSVERRVITGNLLIMYIDSERYKLPSTQRIQLEISDSIIGEKFQQLTIVNSTFEALYPVEIDKSFSKFEVKDYENCQFCTGKLRENITAAKKDESYVRPIPAYQQTLRPNQVWNISKNEWIIVPKPHPRDRAWSWSDETISWKCPKNEQTGELMEQDRTGMTNCRPPESLKRPTNYHSEKKR